jgi:hypothetical protein
MFRVKTSQADTVFWIFKNALFFWSMNVGAGETGPSSV